MGLCCYGPLGLRKMWDSVAVDHWASERCGTQWLWTTWPQEDVGRARWCWEKLGVRDLKHNKVCVHLKDRSTQNDIMYFYNRFQTHQSNWAPVRLRLGTEKRTRGSVRGRQSCIMTSTVAWNPLSTCPHPSLSLVRKEKT